MTTTAEVDREFRRYFMTGPVLEDWQAWADLFTDDATYFDHFYGTFTGPAEITRFLEGTMGAAPHVYSPLVWYVVDGTRVPLEHEFEGVWVGEAKDAGFETGAGRPPQPAVGRWALLNHR